jgi:hypothetical protein
MEEAKQIAVSGYKQVLENGPDVCNSESDSENSDHGNERLDSDMYTAEMLGPEGKNKSGPQLLTPRDVAFMRAAARATKKPVSYTPSTSATTTDMEGQDSVDEYYADHYVSSRLPTPAGTPVNSDNEDIQEEMSEDQKRHLATAKRKAEKSGRAGGQAIRGESGSSQMAAGSGETGTCATRCRPPKT